MTPSVRRSARPPLGLAGMLGLVLLVEGWVARHGPDLISALGLSWRSAGEAARSEVGGRGVLCFGDSLVKFGVIPEVIRQQTGRSAYNLAMPSAPPPASYFLLRRALAAGARPSAVVVDFKPNLLAGGPEFSVRGWQETLGLAEAAELALSARSAVLLARVASGLLLPTVRLRQDLRGAALAAIRGESDPGRQAGRVQSRNWTVNRGALVWSKEPAFVGQVRDVEHRVFQTNAWHCQRLNRLYLERFLGLAESRGIPVLWVLPPISPQLQAARERAGTDGRHTAFVRSIRDRHPGVTVVDGRGAGYPVSVFIDAAHLDRDGAVALSDGLAEVLRGGLDGPRWVPLPPFRPRPMAPVIEDIRGSRLALDALDSRRR